MLAQYCENTGAITDAIKAQQASGAEVEGTGGHPQCMAILAKLKGMKR